jgi:tRNA-dihydrouridine synthase
LDGVLIGQASRGNPWVFSSHQPTTEEKVAVMLSHVFYYLSLGEDDFLPLRKHLAWYATGFSGARKLRSDLVRVGSIEELKKVLSDYGLYKAPAS